MFRDTLMKFNFNTTESLAGFYFRCSSNFIKTIKFSVVNSIIKMKFLNYTLFKIKNIYYNIAKCQDCK